MAEATDNSGFVRPERVRVVRHARQRAAVLQGLVQSQLERREPEARSARPRDGNRSRGARRRVARCRVVLPISLPLRHAPQRPHQLSGRLPGRRAASMNTAGVVKFMIERPPLERCASGRSFRSPAMAAHKPEDWPGLFEQLLNDGDLEGVVALYDPEARFVTRSGETLIGLTRIRDMLAGLIQSKTQLHGRVVQATTVG